MDTVVKSGKMPILNYDDSAFGFFAITFLALYTVPASIYIARTILYWKPEDEADVTAKVSARKRMEM